MIACTVCAFHPLCHSRASQAGAPSPVESRKRLARGQALFRAGSPRVSIFAVRAGFLKERVELPGGHTHIVRFLLPGDAAGLDACDGVHRSDLIALGDCEVCEVPTYRAEILCDFNPRIGAHLRGHIAEELVRSQGHAASLACLGVHRRLAGFLIDLGKRWMDRGYSACSFLLPMSRREIAEHLGLTPETVSRVLGEFQQHGWIKPQRRSVEILDARALAEVLAR